MDHVSSNHSKFREEKKDSLDVNEDTTFAQMEIGGAFQLTSSRQPVEEKKWYHFELFLWFRKLTNKYDNSILMVLGLVYFLQGFKIFLILSVKDLFKQYLNLDPTYAQFLASLTSIPWSCKILYGLIADNFPIMGSRRKAYVILNGAIQCITLWFLVVEMVDDEIFITIMLIINSANSAFLDVVVDALMVAQSRIDPEHGSEDLQGLSWALLAVGGIVGSICSAFFTQYLKPSHTFLACSFFSMIIVIAGYRINPIAEQCDEEKASKGFCQQLRQNISEIKEAMKIPQIYRTVLFFLLCGFIVPSFGDIAYYFQINVIQFTKFTISMLGLIGYICLLLGTIIYKRFLQDKEIRTLLRWSIYIGFIGGVFGLMFALRWNVAMGINDLLFIIFTGVVTDTLALAFTQLPQLVLFAKITPKHIEATIFAVLTGVFNLSNFVISPNMGVIINKFFVGVNINNLENFYILVLISMCLSLVPLFLLPLIPLKAEITTTNNKAETEVLRPTEELEMRTLH